ncbi:MAG: hypothetical protein LBL84_02575 [Candidatus Nomurabacteria bacterium]|jgi:hypothetical protein|nr:hypothetical protein [Candidatus Nomurabacteria bacterium]
MGGNKNVTKRGGVKRGPVPLIVAVVGAVVGVPFVLLSLLVVLWSTPGTMNGVVEEMDGLKIGNNWILKKEQRNPYTFFYVNTVTVPSMYRVYEIPTQIDEEEFRLFAYQDGWEAEKYECVTDGDSGLIEGCAYSGAKGQFRLSINLLNNIPGYRGSDITNPEVHYYVSKKE